MRARRRSGLEEWEKQKQGNLGLKDVAFWLCFSFLDLEPRMFFLRSFQRKGMPGDILVEQSLKH